ncbi:hypothetical protein R1flu_027376 [Riccia fluitans]|uniref:Glycosyltransferase n=1 Tax=Riccia fluitans TaxID=41844 RepID=A0ABD1XMP0_9MARC
MVEQNCRAHLLIVSESSAGHFFPLQQILYLLSAPQYVSRVIVTVAEIDTRLQELAYLKERGDFGSLRFEELTMPAASPIPKPQPEELVHRRESVFQHMKKKLLLQKHNADALTCILSDMFFVFLQDLEEELRIPWYPLVPTTLNYTYACYLSSDPLLRSTDPGVRKQKISGLEFARVVAYPPDILACPEFISSKCEQFMKSEAILIPRVLYIGPLVNILGFRLGPPTTFEGTEKAKCLRSQVVDIRSQVFLSQPLLAFPCIVKRVSTKPFRATPSLSVGLWRKVTQEARSEKLGVWKLEQKVHPTLEQSGFTVTKLARRESSQLREEGGGSSAGSKHAVENDSEYTDVAAKVCNNRGRWSRNEWKWKIDYDWLDFYYESRKAYCKICTKARGKTCWAKAGRAQRMFRVAFACVEFIFYMSQFIQGYWTFLTNLASLAAAKDPTCKVVSEEVDVILNSVSSYFAYSSKRKADILSGLTKLSKVFQKSVVDVNSVGSLVNTTCTEIQGAFRAFKIQCMTEWRDRDFHLVAQVISFSPSFQCIDNENAREIWAKALQLWKGATSHRFLYSNPMPI